MEEHKRLIEAARAVVNDAHEDDKQHGSDIYTILFEMIDELEEALEALSEGWGWQTNQQA